MKNLVEKSMTYSFKCPKCKESLFADVDVGEHMVDWSEICENNECNYKFTSAEVLRIYDDALSDAWASMIDNAHDTVRENL